MSYINKRRVFVHSKQMFMRNLLSSLVVYEKITTSHYDAKYLIILFSKIIKFAKKDNLHSKRQVLNYLNFGKDNFSKKNILNKIFIDFKNRYINRNGGYTRVIKSHRSLGDNSLKSVISLV